MAPTLYRGPAPDEILASMGERIYRATGRGTVARSSSLGYGEDHLRLAFQVGAGRDEVRVETSLRAPSVPFELHDLANRALMHPRRLRFPLTLRFDRTKIGVPVDGREVIFTTYVCGRQVRALADINGLWVGVECSLSRLRRLTLGTEDPKELRLYLRELHKRDPP